jgi:outer membrane protein assembly factor BamE (lipoprotein component of BamABCDE complex)
VTAGSNITREGNYVSEGTYAQIEPGKTTEAWVKATLGDPSSITEADGNSVWKYAYTVKKTSGGTVFLIFGGHSTDEMQHSAFMEFKDGIVTKKWQG